MKLYFIHILISIAIVACVQTPQPSENSQNTNTANVLVLCEGLMGYDNAELSKLNTADGTSVVNYYTENNINSTLGDTSNDGLIKGDTLITCSTGGAFLNFINVKNGKTIKFIKLKEGWQPRKMALINDSLLAISELINSQVIILNIYSGEIANTIKVGPQPEGIAFYNHYIFTTNSGYGDFNYKHPDAHTVSIIDLNSQQEIKKIKTGINPLEVLIDKKNGKFYVAYVHLPSKLDSMGGIMEYSLDNFDLIREWRCYPRSLTLSSDGNSLYFINQVNGKTINWKGISKIDLDNGQIENLIENKENNIWYGLAYDSFDNSIWIANAHNHLTNGDILVYQYNNYESPIYRYNVGLNPNKIFFIR